MSSPTWKNYQALMLAEPDLFTNQEAFYRIIVAEDEAAACERAAQAGLRAEGLPPDWGNIGEVFADQYIRVLRDPVQPAGHGPRTYIRILPAQRLGHGVAVLPVHLGRILVLGHYRHATRQWHLEIPRGFGRKDMTDEQNAVRELREEIGCGSEPAMTDLGEMYPDSGLMAHKVQLFCAVVDQYTAPERSVEAISEIIAMAPREFEQHVGDGRINDSFSICAFMRAKAKSLL